MSRSKKDIEVVEVAGKFKMVMNPETYKITITLYANKYDIHRMILEKGRAVPKKCIKETRIIEVPFDADSNLWSEIRKYENDIEDEKQQN